jgi:ferrous iron transport protein B
VTRVLLVGNPNVGKSSIFSRLTGVEVACSNYPGTTVGYCTGTIRYGEGKAELVDVPGTYSLSAQSQAEKVATDMLHTGDIIIDVVDATNLERNLYLTLQVLETGKPTVVALNMADDARHRGVIIDSKRLEEVLGVPVVETVAVTGEGIKVLSERLADARRVKVDRTEEERWAQVGRIVGEVQALHARGHTVFEAMEDATIKPLTGIPIALAVLFTAFTIIINLGNWAVGTFLDPFFIGYYVPALNGLLGPVLPEGIAHDMLLGQGTDIVGGLGLLTAGVYVPAAMILPFVALFYFVLGILEDVGYLPRLATLMDNVMHRLGLHGSAVIPAVLGLGCRVPGILATRILETRKQRFIAATLMSICIPCLAQNAVIIGLLSRHGMRYVLIVYGTLALLYVLAGLALNRIVKGESPEMLLEIPPYRMPMMSSLAKKTWMHVRHFIFEAVPYILLGVFAVNVLKISGVLDAFSDAVSPVMAGLFGLPREAAIALIMGFLRKDFAVGMLAPIAMTPMQLTVASTLLVTYAPCLATLTVLYRELGFSDFLRSMAVMLAATAATGVVLKALLL